MEIKGKTFELNNYIEVVFTNENGYQELQVGRIFDYDNDKIYFSPVSITLYFPIYNPAT